MPGRAPEPSQSRVDDDDGDGTFRGIMIGCLGFSDEGVYMGEDLTPGALRAPRTTCSRAGRLCGSLVALLRLSFSVRVRDGNIWTGFSSRAIPRIFPV